eukprot:Amastigsp_a509527_108.p3 type:complete len:105 gc:universal Amastigsp_a509527_108:561-247(-)
MAFLTIYTTSRPRSPTALACTSSGRHLSRSISCRTKYRLRSTSSHGSCGSSTSGSRGSISVCAPSSARFSSCRASFGTPSFAGTSSLHCSTRASPCRCGRTLSS